MEKPPISIKELSPIILRIIEKIQILDSLTTKQEKINCTNELLNTVLEFRLFFEKASVFDNKDESMKIFKERLERAFSRFEWDANVCIASDDFQKHSENSKFFLSSVLKLLGMKHCGILIIEIHIKLCINTIHKMSATDKENQKKDQLYFKLLLDSIFNSAKILKKYLHNILLLKQRHIVALCLNQLCKGLLILLEMIRVKNMDIKKFVLKTLEQCLNQMLQAIHSEENLQTIEYGGEFITLMDFCLNKLNSIASNAHDYQSFIEKAQQITFSIKPMIDEILCYGMSIYHVSQFDNDRSALMSSSLKVLKEYNDLSESVNKKTDVNNVKLNAESVGEFLCCFERHVNIAVLHLVLEVFSGVNSPLRNIVKKCKEGIQKNNKTVDDLKVLISDFDFEMDRIMQIGFFTVSCTADCNKILSIQSCLASLESLETELISALTALYIDCTSKHKSNFQYLIDIWLKEITELKLVIDSTLDAAGFCEIVFNQVKTLVVNLKIVLCTDDCLPEAKKILNKIIRYSKKLLKTLLRSLQEEDEKMMKDTEKFVNNFKSAIEDCVKINQLLENAEECKIKNKIQEKLDFLLKELEKLCAHLFTLVNEEKSLEKSNDKYCESLTDLSYLIPKKNYYKMCYSTTLLSESPSTSENVDILTPYVNKGVLKSKKRSILYTTPTPSELKFKENFDEILLRSSLWEKTPISKNRSRCCKSLSARLELSNNINLEITNALDELSQLSGTLSQSLILSNYSKTESNANNQQINKDEYLENRKESRVGPVYKSSGCCVNMDATEQFIIKANQTEMNEVENQNTEKNSLSFKFQQSLNSLSQNPSLFVPQDEDCDTDLNTPNRLIDLKNVEEKIDFLKQHVLCEFP